MANFRTVAPPLVVPEAIRQQLSTGLVATAPLYQGPLVRYSLVRSGPEDHDVRVGVTTGISGYLALYEIEADGNAKRLYPPTVEALRVLPNATIEVPDKAIAAREGLRLRLIFVPSPVAATNGFLAGVPPSAGAGSTSRPLVVDIPVAP